MSKVRELYDRAFERRRPIACEELAYAIEDDEAGLAKTRELPPLPLSVLEWLEGWGRGVASPTPWLRDLLAWFDATYPKPRSQAELDAECLDELATEVCWRGSTYEMKLRAIAKRLREGKTT